MSTENLTMGAVLTALIVILQFLAIGVKALMPFLPFTFSLVLIPIVIGAAKCGPYMGAWLGFVFGVIVLLSGDAAAFLMINSVLPATFSFPPLRSSPTKTSFELKAPT